LTINLIVCFGGISFLEENVVGSFRMSGMPHEVEYDPLEYYEDPYPIYRQLRETAPVYHNAERGLWILSRYADVQAAARDHKTFISGRGADAEDGLTLGPGDFLDMDPPRHDALRRILNDTFTPTALKALEPMIVAKVEELLDRLIDRGHGDFARDFARPLPLSIICELWGFPKQDHKMLENWFERMVERVSGEAIQDDVRLAGEEMRAYIDEAVRERRNRSRGDLLSTMAQAVTDGRMTENEVAGMTRLLLVAGIHTTETLIANSLYLLASMPKERRALADDPSRIPVAIEELLRYESPVQWLARATTKDVNLHGEVIPKGQRVVLLWASANRDDRQFQNPDLLDLRRTPNNHLAFGQGIHFCIGAPLARLESRIAFKALFTRIPEYRIAGPVERRFTRQERGICRLPVEFASTQKE
jgi:cytochrome P450